MYRERRGRGRRKRTEVSIFFSGLGALWKTLLSPLGFWPSRERSKDFVHLETEKWGRREPIKLLLSVHRKGETCILEISLTDLPGHLTWESPSISRKLKKRKKFSHLGKTRIPVGSLALAPHILHTPLTYILKDIYESFHHTTHTHSLLYLHIHVSGDRANTERLLFFEQPLMMWRVDRRCIQVKEWRGRKERQDWRRTREERTRRKRSAARAVNKREETDGEYRSSCQGKFCRKKC